MCGIAALLSLRDHPADPRCVRAMLGLIAHRGPDGSGVFADGPIALGHTRLSIVDVEGGAQPMANADRTLWITFNGEIYNHVELREALRSRGHRFSTRSDTEVILHLYEEHGDDCVRELNGQWAFVLWDARARRVLASRDRLGVRPLFYVRSGERLAFASEIKALFVLPEVRREIDPIALDQVFTFWTTLPPRTAFRDVHELPPGHSLVAERGAVTIRRHAQLDFGAGNGHAPGAASDPREQAERLLDLLADATRLRLRADVPVGAYLSGGLDSTLVVALARRYAGQGLKTFSVAFDDPEFDESRFQQLAARELGTDHRVVHCTTGEIGKVFPDVVWHTEKPILRTAPAPMYLLSRLVRDTGIKVVLTGEGADEVFGGYDIFKEAKIRRFWARQPGSRLRPLLLRRLYPYLGALQRQPAAYLQAFFRAAPDEVGHPFFSHLPRWELTARLKTFLSRDVRAEVDGYDGYAELAEALPAEYGRWDDLSRAQYLEAAWLLPGYILSSQGDRVAMAHAVEGRFPFLDHRVVAFGSRLPSRLKLRVLVEKYLLKRAAAGLVPDAVRARAKQPYRAPDGAAFFEPSDDRKPLPYVAELLSPERLARDGLFEPKAVQRLVAKVRSGQAIGIRDNMAIVGILSTQILVDRFVNHFEQRAPCGVD